MGETPTLSPGLVTRGARDSWPSETVSDLAGVVVLAVIPERGLSG